MFSYYPIRPKFSIMKLVNIRPLLSILYLIKHLSFPLCKTQGSRYLSQVKKKPILKGHTLVVTGYIFMAQCLQNSLVDKTAQLYTFPLNHSHTLRPSPLIHFGLCFLLLKYILNKLLRGSRQLFYFKSGLNILINVISSPAE